MPETFYVEGVAVGQATVTVLLKDSNGTEVTRDEVKVTSAWFDMVAYRPQNPRFELTKIPDDEVAGIRRSDGSPSDLIRIDLTTLSPIMDGVEWVLRRTLASPLIVWGDSDRTELLLSRTETEYVIGADGMLWVEWSAPHASMATSALELVLRTDTGDPRTDDKVVFYDDIVFDPFESIVIAYVGEGQSPVDAPEVGLYDVAEALYNDGYDVHIYDEDDILVDDYPGFLVWVASGGNLANPYPFEGEEDSGEEVITAVSNRGVTDVAIMGYSHGGGATLLLSEYLRRWKAGAGQNEDFEIEFTAYVDAVYKRSPNDPLDLAYESVQERPYGTDYHFNVFQDEDDNTGLDDLFEGDVVPGSEWEDFVAWGGGQYYDPEDEVNKTDKNSGNLNLPATHSSIDNDVNVQNHLITQLKGHIGR